MIARLTLASAYRLEGEIYFWLQDDAEANRFFDLAIKEIKVVLTPLEEAEQYRILAQAHLYLGAAYTQQAEILRKEGDVEDSRALYENAQAAYATCIAQAEEGKAPHDEILKSKIIADSCQPWSDYVEEVLITLP
jgi:Flp pilus assembly CpaE family ATPase